MTNTPVSSDNITGNNNDMDMASVMNLIRSMQEEMKAMKIQHERDALEILDLRKQVAEAKNDNRSESEAAGRRPLMLSEIIEQQVKQDPSEPQVTGNANDARVVSYYQTKQPVVEKFTLLYNKTLCGY